MTTEALFCARLETFIDRVRCRQTFEATSDAVRLNLNDDSHDLKHEVGLMQGLNKKLRTDIVEAQSKHDSQKSINIALESKIKKLEESLTTLQENFINEQRVAFNDASKISSQELSGPVAKSFVERLKSQDEAIGQVQETLWGLENASNECKFNTQILQQQYDAMLLKMENIGELFSGLLENLSRVREQRNKFELEQQALKFEVQTLNCVFDNNK